MRSTIGHAGADTSEETHEGRTAIDEPFINSGLIALWRHRETPLGNGHAEQRHIKDEAFTGNARHHAATCGPAMPAPTIGTAKSGTDLWS